MSLEYWVIDGVGMDANVIRPHINKKKLAMFLREQLSGELDIVNDMDRMLITDDFSDLDIDDYIGGSPFENIADILTYCDDTDTLTFALDGDGRYFLYYPPSMPWEMRDTEPQSIEEVHERIITAVQKLTDLDAKTIDKWIDNDLYVIGCG